MIIRLNMSPAPKLIDRATNVAGGARFAERLA
jgi:hypothetical protein